MPDYPDWCYYPLHDQPPEWVTQFIAVVAGARTDVESRAVDSLSSDRVLSFLRPGLEALGYRVETGKQTKERALDVDLLWEAATDPERRTLIEELLVSVAVFPDHLEVTIAGSPRRNVTLSEVGLKESRSVGVRGVSAPQPHRLVIGFEIDLTGC